MVRSRGLNNKTILLNILICLLYSLGFASISYTKPVSYKMAGCEIKPLAQAYPDYTQIKGEFLSIYASSDSIASSCQNVFSKAIIGICYKEIALKSDRGHQLFFEPKSIWIDPVITWLNEREK